MRALPPPHPILASLTPICVLGSLSPWLVPEAHPNFFPRSVPVPSSPTLSPHPAWCQGPAPIPGPQPAPPR